MTKSIILKIIFILFFSISPTLYACTCSCLGDCSFSKISEAKPFVALIKVIEYSDNLDWETNDNSTMPYSITVEIIKKYKGTENRKKIKIWGDNGMLCRPYISNFKIGEYYLIAPNLLTKDSSTGKSGDYDLFACHVDYLNVDFDRKIALGKYSKWKKRISLKKFERLLLQ